LLADTGDSPPSSLHVSSESLRLLESSLYEVDDSDLGLDKPHPVLARADNSSTSVLVPDTKTWRSTALIYLFISPGYTAQQLCTSCTKAVLTAYAKFETATPYALGIAESPLLGDQPDLWNNVTAKCNTTFTNDILNSAGYNTDPATDVSAASQISIYGGSVVALAVGVAAFLAL